MNCSISTRMPLPTARNAVPMAAVVLPFPGPVFTMMSPRRMSGITKFDCTYGPEFAPDDDSRDGACLARQVDTSAQIQSSRVHLDDTIVAIATPPGRGGIGVVRLAGPEAVAIASPMLRLRHELEPGRAVFGELIEPCGANPPAHPRDEEGTGLGRAVGSPQSDPVVRPPSAGRAGSKPPDRDRIDEVVVTYFAKPHSYTTDDIVE